MSLSENPASRNRFFIASEAVVTLPTESVVLISISCLKMSSASFRVASSAGESCCACIEAVNSKQKNGLSHHFWDPKFILHQNSAKKYRVSRRRGKLTDSLLKSQADERIRGPHSALASMILGFAV